MAVTITGVVFNDLRRDGQYNVGNPGIPNVFVVLYGPGGCVATQTDTNGIYSFIVTQAGTYTIYETVSDPGNTCPPTIFTQPTGFTMSNGPRKLTVNVTSEQISGNVTIGNQNFSHDTLIAPIECSATMIQFIGRPSNWYNIDIVTGQPTLYTVVSPANDVNAIGYNPLDNYIYGYDHTTNNIVRIDNAGNIINLFPSPPGLPVDAYNNGTFDDNGFFYLFTNGSNRFYTVDLRPNSPTFMKLVDPENGYIEQTGNYGTALSTVINAADWVYNQDDGFLYGLEPNGVMDRIDPTTGAVTPLATTGPNPNALFGALAIDRNGTIYAISNGDGSIYQYTIDGDTATGEYFASTFFASFNDATMCPNAAVDIDYGDAPDLGAGNGPGNYNSLLAQNGPRHQMINELYLGTQVTADPDARQNATATGDDLINRIQDDGLTVPLQTLSVSATGYTLDVTVTNQTGTPANLYGWVDFNQNGLFENDEAAAVEIVPSAVGTQTVTLSFTVPAGTTLTAGSTFVRLRLTTEDLVDSGTETQDTRSVGPAADGEVEDYILGIGEVADLSVTKTANTGTVIAGETLTYTITVGNNGPDTATNVVVQDDIPPTIQNPVFSTDGGTTWNPWPGSYNIPSLASGGSVTILIEGTVDPNATGSILNTVTVTSDSEDPNPDDNTDTEETLIDTSADLTIEKTADPNPATAGEELTFTITITNNGPSDARDVYLSDVLSSQILNPEFSTDGGISWNPWASPYFIGILPTGETITVLIRGEVDPSATGVIPNTAEVTSSTPDPNPGDNTSTIDVPVNSSANLSIVKLSSPNPVETGELLTYTLIITNSGPSDAEDVILTDDVPSELTGVEFSTDNGLTWNPWTSPYTIGTLTDGASVIILIRGTVSPAAFETITNTATIDSTTPDPDPGDNSSTVDTDVTTSADLVITKTGDANPVASGSVLTYTIDLTNNGPSDAQNVIIEDTTPADLLNPEFSIDNGTSWNPWTGSYSAGTVAAGASITVLLRGTVNPTATGTLVNTVTVTTNTPDPDPDSNTDTEITAINTLADLSVTKTGSPNPAISGQLLTYTIEITNNGPDDADDVTLTDTLPPELTGGEFSTDGGTTWNPWTGTYLVGTITNGTTTTILIRGTVDSGATGLIVNTAEVESTTPDLNPDNNTDTETIGIDQSANLSITKTASPSPIYAGDVLTYTVEVTNNGPSDAVNVIVADVLDAALTNAEFSTDGGTTWNPWISPYTIGTMTSGATQTILIRGTINPTFTGRIINTASVTTDTPDPDPDDNSVTIETPVGQLADLSITKVGSPNPILPGETITYTITINNAGPSASQSTVLVDAVPSTLSNVEFSLDNGTTWNPWVSPYNLGTVLPGTPVTVLLRGQLSNSAAGNLENTATVNSATPDPDPSNNSDTDTTTITPAADISVVKTVTVSPAIAGGQTTFLIVISNAGPVNAENVTLTDDLPADISNAEFSTDNGLTWNPWVSPYALGTLVMGESRSVQIRGILDSSTTGTFPNTASVDSTTPDPNPDNNTSTIDVPVVRSADLSIQKTADSSTAVVGEQLVYTINITNNGPSDADNVLLTDVLPDIFLNAEFSVDGGTTWNDWVSPYNLGTIVSGDNREIQIRGTVGSTVLSAITNTASVTSDDPDPNPDNNTSTSVTPLETIADIAITKTVNNNQVVFGDTVIYTLTIVNNGPSPAQNVTLSDVLPTGLSRGMYSIDGGTTWLPWSSPYNMGMLESGETRNILIRGTVNTSAPSVLTNTGSVSSNTPDPNPDNNTDSEDINVIFANLSIQKTANPVTVIAGEEITYTITINNSGPNDAENVTLADVVTPPLLQPEYSLDGGTSWTDWTGSVDFGTIANGGTTTVLIRGTVNPSTIDSVINAATVTSSTPDPDPSDNTTTIETPADTSANLSIVKTGEPNPVIAGEELTYTIIISNSGPSDAINVSINDDIPQFLTDVTFSTDGGITWQNWVSPYVLGTIGSGQTAEILLRGTVSPSATENIVNTVTTDSETPDPDPSGNTSTETTPVDTSADLAAFKTAAVEYTRPGDTIIYTITVQNYGPSDAEDVLISDDPIQGLDDVQFSTDGGSTWLPWSSPYLVGNMAGGSTTEIQIRGIVQSGIDTLSNTAVVSSTTPDPDPSNNTSTIIIPAEGTADLTVTKTALPNPARAGELLTYTVIITNNGPDNAENVVLSDILPSEITNPEFSLDQGATWNIWSGSISLGTITGGGQQVILIRGILRTTSLSVSNTVTVSSTTPDPDPSNNSFTDNTSVDGLADLAIIKTASPNPATKCCPIIYSLTVYNFGPGIARSVVLTDTLQNCIINACYSQDYGRNWNKWNGTLELGNLEPDTQTTIFIRGVVNSCVSGMINNTAFVYSQTTDPNLQNNQFTLNTCIQPSCNDDNNCPCK